MASSSRTICRIDKLSVLALCVPLCSKKEVACISTGKGMHASHCSRTKVDRCRPHQKNRKLEASISSRLRQWLCLFVPRREIWTWENSQVPQAVVIFFGLVKRHVKRIVSGLFF